MQRSILLLCFLFLTLYSKSQTFEGIWQGNFTVNSNDIPIIFHIHKNSTGKLIGTIDSPKQQALGIPCEVIAKEDSIILMANNIKGKYVALLNKDKSQLIGTWSQRGGSILLNVNKITEETFEKLVSQYQNKRPQTPKPPFPYNSEDVEYDNADKTIHFGATLTYPKTMMECGYANSRKKHIEYKNPQYPAVILITGSGQQDRDETILDHKPFAVIADYLTQNGIAVLRVDDRGVGKTTGPVLTATTADFAKDVEASLNYLLTRKEVDKKNIGLIGHSEGGMIAPIVASNRPEIKCIVLLAGPGVKIIDLMEQQTMDVLVSTGAPKHDVELFRPLYKPMVNAMLKEQDETIAKNKAIAIFKKWKSTVTIDVVKHTTGVVDDKSLDEYVIRLVKTIKSPWFNYFIQFDPSIYLKKLNCAVLALNGDKDIQVSSKLNLPAIQIALEKSKSKQYKVQEISGLNHLFQHCTKCTVEEYVELEETFSPEVLNMMSDWINQVVKK